MRATRARQQQHFTSTRVSSDHAFSRRRNGITLDLVEQRFGFKGLEHEVAGAAAHRRHSLVDIAEGSHQQHGQAGFFRADFVQ